MPATRYGQSIWLSRSKSTRIAYPKLNRPMDVPIAIIGGGLTGCAAAYALAAAGQRVALFEAHQLAGGATGLAAGLLLAVPGVDFLVMEKAHGRKVARALWQDTRRAALDAQATLRRLNVKCDLRSADAITLARTDVEAKALRRELAALKDAGLEGSWLTGRAVTDATGIEAIGGMKTASHATLDPYRAAIGLARAAAARGATVFERTPIGSVKHTRTGVELSAGAVRVRAGTVVLATGTPAPLVRALARHFVDAETYAVLTPPLGADVRRTAGTREAIVTDRAEPPHRLYWTSDARVLWTGADQGRVGDRQRQATLVQRSGQLMYELSLVLPAISGVQPEFGWHAPWSRSVDQLPFIGPHRNYPHHLFAMGLGANLAAAFLASRILVRAVTGGSDKSDEYFGFSRLASRRGA
jgi:glycine/D-amino acid oxidase-like deaminating enzyme